MNIERVDEATERLLAQGVRVLSGHLLGATEREHAARLLELMRPRENAVILDAGCGVGEVARLMQELRADLEFKLLNISDKQLAHCPPGMQIIKADYAATGLPDSSVDVVMFGYSLCHSLDCPAAFREARRVLREGGVLFINDLVRSTGDNRLARVMFDSSFHFPVNLMDWARQAGFVLDEALVHETVVERLREVAGSALYDQVFAGTVPATLRFTRTTIADPVVSAFARHRRIGFQFSGGRDSTAALYLLKPYWDQMTVYHLDTGDQFPETRAVVKAVERDVPITRIHSDVHAVRERYGMPSDVVPVDNTEVGRMVSGRGIKLQGRYECCSRSLMHPMHERMRQDGITLIVRGQRDDEYAAPPKRSGDTGDGFEVLYPIQAWSGERASEYLRDNELPLAPFYERGARRAPECMGCTAWWDEGRAGYMKDHHPEAFEAYRHNVQLIRVEIVRQLDQLEG